MQARLALIAALSAALVATPALAQDKPRETDPAGAAALFQQGREAAKKQDFATACARFAESYRLDPAPGTLLNLGDCNQHLGKIASAWQRFREATEHLPQDDDRVAVARQRVAELEPKLPRLVIVLAPNAPPGTSVSRDKVELGAASLEVALPVDPGAHTIRVDAPGYLPRFISVTLVEGKTERVVVEPGAEVPISTRIMPQLAPPRGLGPLRTAGVVVAGAGVASIGVAIATGLILPSKEQVVKQHCDASHFCDPTGLAAAHDGQTLATINTVTWIAGGVAVAAGAALFIFGSRSASSPRAALLAAPAPDGGAASLQGSF
jgi:PEGA domain